MTATALRPRRRDASDRSAAPRADGTPLRMVAAICLLGSFMVATGVNGVISATLLGLGFLLVPGIFVVDAAAPGNGPERIAIVAATSITFWMVVAHLLLTFQWWEPRLAASILLLTAGIIAIERTTRSQSAATFSGSISATLTRASSFNKHVGGVRWAVSAIAVVLWAISLSSIDTDNFDDWGLVTAVPPTYFVAVALATILAATAATASVTSPRRTAIGIAPLLLMIYGTLPILVTTIRYPWSYKHVGVIRLLDETGRLHPDVDIYNNFSGFFGLGALHRGATGIDPTSYAAWTQLFAEGLILVAVWALVRRATGSERVAHLAAVLYLITNWVGQNYFAAQTLATFLSVTMLALLIAWFMNGQTRGLSWARFGRVQPSIDRLAPAPDARPDYLQLSLRRALVLWIFLGLVMSHPLTPFAALGVVGFAWVIGWLRDRWLLVGLGAVCVGWLLRSLTYFAAQSFDVGFGGAPADNADGNLDYSGAPDAVVMVGNLTRIFSVSVWLIAFIGALVCAWAMRRTGVLAIAACIPFTIPLVQSYGGEVIYRVYLYSLPLIVGFIAWGIVSTTPLAKRSRLPQTPALASVVCLLLTAGFLVAHFGRERINTVETSEVAMGDYIAATIADPALLAQFDGTYPAASSARYPSFQVNDTYVPYVVDMVGESASLPSTAALDGVADDLIALDAGVPYVIVSPGMIDSVQQVAALPIASTQAAVDFLTSNERYVVRHRIGDTWLVEVLP